MDQKEIEILVGAFVALVSGLLLYFVVGPLILVLMVKSRNY